VLIDGGDDAADGGGGGAGGGGGGGAGGGGRGGERGVPSLVVRRRSPVRRARARDEFHVLAVDGVEVRGLDGARRRRARSDRARRGRRATLSLRRRRRGKRFRKRQRSDVDVGAGGFFPRRARGGARGLQRVVTRGDRGRAREVHPAVCARDGPSKREHAVARGDSAVLRALHEFHGGGGGQRRIRIRIRIRIRGNVRE